MNTKIQTILLDDFALLAYLNNETGARQVQLVLKNAEEKKCRVLISAITLGEVLRIIEREVGLVKAQAAQAAIEQLPIRIESCTDAMALDAAHLAAQYGLSFEGAVGAVLAMKHEGIVFTGDEEFEPLKNKLKIEWLRSIQDEAQPERNPTKANIRLRDLTSENDYEEMAVLFTIEEDFTATAKGLKDEYEKKKGLVQVKVAENDQGIYLGFYWIEKSQLEPGRGHLYLIVKPEQRQQGTGTRLLSAAMKFARQEKLTRLRVAVRDSAPECVRFACQNGFVEINHQISMDLDLDGFDFGAYDGIISGLKNEGFLFTSMAELGDTPEAQRNLFELNESTSMDTMGSDGSRSWKDFEDFQKTVCHTKWYKPEGQKVVIDTQTGKWAAMCAIGLFDGQGYNLHTGVDRDYRGRGLGQAVKVTGLRYAKDVLKVNKIFTHHNTKNEPMLAIDRKLGYQQISGTYSMEKVI